MNLRFIILFVVFIIISLIRNSVSIRCYQCSSAENRNHDTCGAYETFDHEINIPVDCQDYESVTPGTFCVKITQQGPRGFIWDGRWRQVVRRCASVSDTGVTGVCNWGVYDNGVYWEECYCSEDACNGSKRQSIIPVFLIGIGIFSTIWL